MAGFNWEKLIAEIVRDVLSGLLHGDDERAAKARGLVASPPDDLDARIRDAVARRANELPQK